jgi:hypothetical protein|nr:MAG TPA: Protein of unknown function (DUF1566) [Caudoviricetes sp.]
MKVNIENLRQSVMMPTKEDRADWTSGLYLIYEDGHAEPFTGDNFKDCVRYIGLKHKDVSFAISLTEHKDVQLLDNDSREEFGNQIYYGRECDALFDMNGQRNTAQLIERNPKLSNLLKDDEYIPSLGQLNLIAHYQDNINDVLRYIGKEPLSSTWYWSSTEYSLSLSWYVHFFSGQTSNGNKCYSYRVRAVAAFTLFMSIKEKMNRGQQI